MHAAQTKVLIVEDEGIVAYDIERRLVKAGYEVPAIVSSGQEALSQIEQTAPDLVLMDIHLKGPSDGIQLAAEVRDRFQLPVVFITAYADKVTLERAKATEPFSYLVKPVSHVNLASAIEIALYKHRIEQELRKREAWLQTVLRFMPEAVVVTDVCGSIQFLNPSAERLTGWSHIESVGRPVAEVLRLVDFADRDISGDMQDAIGAGITWELPDASRLISRDGSAVMVEGELAISRLDGRPTGTVLSLRDVTSRHWKEAHVRREQKMEVAGRLANGIARDFNRLLMVILKYSEQLLSEMEPGSVFQRRVKAIHRAAYSAAVLTGQVLGLCRKEPAEARSMDLNSVVNHFLPLLKRTAGPSIVVETNLDPGLGRIRADISQMEQVLLNLVLNARDAMAQGGRVSIQTTNVPPVYGDAPFVRLAVEDNGAGMDTDTAEHMFEPFFTSKKPREGTGLGLAVVHAIVSAGDGLINVDSKPGAGTLFEIFLPVSEAAPRISKGTRTSVGVGT